MESLKTVLFEEPLGAYVALTVIALLGLVSYLNWRTMRSAWPAWLAIIAAAAVFTLSTLVVTDREQISALCDEAERTINSRDMAGLGLLMDDKFAGQNQFSTRNKALKWIESQLEEHEITSVKLRVVDMKVKDDLATTLIRSDIASRTVPAIRLRWRVVWMKRPDGWLVSKAGGPIFKPDALEDE